jgi:ATP-binding cassette subfamily B protein
MNLKYNLSKLLYKLWLQIGIKRQIEISFLFILMLITSVSEIISIGAVFPFLGALTSPETLFQNHNLESIFLFLKIDKPENILFPLTILFVCSLIFSGIMRLILLWYQTKISFAIGADISHSLFKNTLYKPYYEHLNTNSSEVISMISNKANEVTSQVLMPVLTIFSSVFMIIMIIGTLMVINTTVALVSSFGLGFIYFLIIKLTKKKLSRNSKIINKESALTIKILQEGLGNIRDVLIDGTQDLYCQLYKKTDTSLRKAKASITIIGGSPRFGIEALGMSLIAVIAYKISISSEGNFISNAIPVLGSMALGAQRLLPVLQLTFTSWTFIRGSEASLNDTLNILDENKNISFSQTTSPISFTENFKIKDLNFSYNINGPEVLSNISFEIKKGSKIGIIGATGSGKSTLLDIITCLLSPTKGNLFVDGKVINNKNYRSWQQLISHVPQTIYLSDTTIAENIAFGVPLHKIDYDLVKRCARKADIDFTIENWDNKYNTIVGERGVRLSGGQRQRIAIARALYKQSQILIFDEATSALDNDTEESVMAAIDNLSYDLTIIIVAHRLTTLKNCDCILKLEKGTIKSIEKYENILK